jgi:hypothetical protein
MVIVFLEGHAADAPSYTTCVDANRVDIDKGDVRCELPGQIETRLAIPR